MRLRYTLWVRPVIQLMVFVMTVTCGRVTPEWKKNTGVELLPLSGVAELVINYTTAQLSSRGGSILRDLQSLGACPACA